MTTTIVSTDSIGINNRYTFSDPSDIFVLAANTRLIGSGYSYLYGTTAGIDVTIDGYVWLEANLGSPFYFSGGDNITIGADAQLVLTASTAGNYAGIMLGTFGTGGTQFTNHGEITTRAGQGFSIDSGNNNIRNHGMIDITSGFMRFNTAGGDRLTNTGTITGTSDNLNGLIDVQGAGFFLTNAGVIITGSGFYAIRDTAAAGSSVYVNSGTIAAQAGIAIEVLTASASVFNSGTISGLFTAMLLSGADNYVRNSGTIEGSVFLGTGADTFDGTGGITTSAIIGGAGSDTYITSSSGMIINEFTGGGIDSVLSSASFRLSDQVEILTLRDFAVSGIGNASGNAITGSAADNRLWGLGGADSLLGLEGDDVMGGGDANDTLRGGDGDDWLRGGVGNDSLFGIGDNDTLTGGLGADTMNGGAGNDRFVFVRQTESGTAVVSSDLITDFVRGQDVIDLSGVDARTTNAVPNDAFTFIGSAAFSNVAGQLRYGSAAGVTTVQMDVNGNGTTDIAIRLTGTFALTAQDFIL